MNKILRSVQSLTTSLTIKPMKMVLVVRNDVRMSKGKVASQCSHAAVMCYRNAPEKLVNTWIHMGQPKVVLRVETLDELKSLAKSAEDHGIVNEMIKDAGKTQIEQGTITVLGLGPDYVENLDKIVKHLKLL